MPSIYVAYLLLAPLFFILVSLVFSNFFKWQRGCFLISIFLYGAVLMKIGQFVFNQGSLVLAVGSWGQLFSINLYCDMLTWMMLSVVAIVMLSVGIATNEPPDKRGGSSFFFPLVGCLLLGVTLAFLTADLFNLYVSFELMLIASYVLLTMRTKKQEIIGGLPYILINIVGSAFFLIVVTILYRMTGTLNVASITEFVFQSTSATEGKLLGVSAFLLFCVFGIKSAIFPLGVWLPNSYNAPSVSVSALFAGLLTKVGVYCFIRFFPLLFAPFMENFQSILLGISVITMFVGVLGAVAQDEIRNLLSYHIVSQIGYMVAVFSLGTPVALAIATFYMIHNIFAKTNLFYIAGILEVKTGEYLLSKMGKMMKSGSFLVFSFLVSACALAGIPPLSGFWGKVMIIKELLRGDFLLTAGSAILCSLLTTFSMLKIWNEAFLKEEGDLHKNVVELSQRQKNVTGLYGASGLLTVSILALSCFFLYGQKVFNILTYQLANPYYYIQAILGV